MAELLGYYNSLWKPIKEFTYKGEPEEFTLQPGKYLLVCGGARGGRSFRYDLKSYGGISYGVLDLKESSSFYAVVGGDGEDFTPKNTPPAKGGYNGGGDGGLGYTGYVNGPGGGGASDIRLTMKDTVISATYTIPNDFQELTFIKSKGNQCINTGYLHRADTKIVCDCEVYSRNADYEAVFGARLATGSANNFTFFSRFEGKDIPCYGRNTTEQRGAASSIPYGQRINIIAEGQKVEWSSNNEVIGSITNPAVPNEGQTQMFIFDLNNPSSPDGITNNGSFSIAKIYSFKIYNGDQLVHCFVPCKTKNVEIDFGDIEIENGSIIDSGNSDSEYRVRSKGSLQWSSITKPRQIMMYASDINGNPLQVNVLSYDANGVLLKDDYWYESGHTFYIGAKTHSLRFCISIDGSHDHVITADMIGNVSFKYVDGEVGLCDILHGTFHPDIVSTSSSTDLFECGEDVETPTELTGVYYTEPTSLSSRIIVAGGGGGCQGNTYANYTANGGGAFGGCVVSGSNDPNDTKYATQTDGFTFGQGMTPNQKTGVKNCGTEGAGGGGGGWFGGYASAHTNCEYSTCNGGGGSGYVFTESSYKTPLVERVIDPKYYLTDTMLSCGQATEAFVKIYKETVAPDIGDTILFPNIGRTEEMNLFQGTYEIECYGGDGGVRFDLSHSGRGGYVRGTLTNTKYRKIFVTVGGSGISNGLLPPFPDNYNPSMSFNGGGAPGSTSNYRSCAGGGASDIRLVNPIGIDKSRLPSGYKELEYIETTSLGNYIRTDYKHKPNTSVEWIGIPKPKLQSGVYEKLFGSRRTRGAGNDQQFSFGVSEGTNKSVEYVAGNDHTKNTYYYDATKFPYNEKVRIRTNGSSCSWYIGENLDELGETGTVEDTLTEGCNNLILFGMANATESSPNSGLFACGVLYSFKIWEDDVLVRDYVPCYRKSDNVIGIYDLVNSSFISATGTFSKGPEILSQEDLSLYSRIIVAGGGGGQGSPSNYGGAGGGESGVIGSGKYGTTPGPGTQTGTPQDTSHPIVNGSFGKGGNGSYANDGFGGAGGGGWYGGSGTYPDSSGDDDRGGCGGSGYVYTEASYKPDKYGINDPTDYLSDTYMMTGGNSLPQGMSRIVLTCNNIQSVRFLASDDEGYKFFNIETKSWEYFHASELTPDIFVEYGAFDVTTDQGLLNEYTIYAYNDNSHTDKISVYASPYNPLRIKAYTDTGMKADKFTIDADYNEDSCDVDIVGRRTGTGDDAKLMIDMNINVKSPGEIVDIYCVHALSVLKSTSKATRYIKPVDPNHRYEPEPGSGVLSYESGVNYSTGSRVMDPDTGREYDVIASYTSKSIKEDLRENYIKPKKKYLLKVGAGSNKQLSYRNFLGTYSDETIDTIYCRLSAINRRTLYLLMDCVSSGGTKFVRIKAVNMITSKTRLIADIPWALLGSKYHGGFLVDDNYGYITHSTNDSYQTIYRFSLNNPSEIKSFTFGSGQRYRFTSFGKMMWKDKKTIMLDTYNGCVEFNTNNRIFTEHYYSTNKNNRRDFCVGKRYFISNRNGTSTSSYVYDMIGDLWCDLATTFCTLPVNALISTTYDDDNNQFIFVQTGYITFVDEATMTIVKSVPTSWGVPKSAHYTNGYVFITINDSSLMWVFDIKNNRFDGFYLDWSMNGLSETTITRPSVFKGYFFQPYWTLLVFTFQGAAKYNFGGKYSQYQILYNKTNITNLSYDENFVTVYDDFVEVHDGNIQKETVEDSVCDEYQITHASFNKNEYSEFINLRANTVPIDEPVPE